jgi:hypothetical protein
MCWHTPAAGHEQVAVAGPDSGSVTSNSPTHTRSDVPVSPAMRVSIPRSRSFCARRSSPLLASASKAAEASEAASLLDLIHSVETSVRAAQVETQHVDLSAWIGKKAHVWARPCEVINGPSPRLKYITVLFYAGELRLDQLLLPERFTEMEGTIEKVPDHGRALFRTKRSRKAGLELARSPDRGSGSILWPSGRDPHFPPKIQSVE